MEDGQAAPSALVNAGAVAPNEGLYQVVAADFQDAFRVNAGVFELDQTRMSRTQRIAILDGRKDRLVPRQR